MSLGGLNEQMGSVTHEEEEEEEVGMKMIKEQDYHVSSTDVTSVWWLLQHCSFVWILMVISANPLSNDVYVGAF